MWACVNERFILLLILGKLLYFLPSSISQELTFVYLYGVVTFRGAEWNR